MKKIRYSIENKTVWEDIYDTKLKTVMNFRGIYTGTSKKDCEEWLKRFKRGLEDARVNKRIVDTEPTPIGISDRLYKRFKKSKEKKKFNAKRV